MSLWANILEVILEFTMVVIILVLNGNSNNTFTSWDFHFDHLILAYLGITIALMIYAWYKHILANLFRIGCNKVILNTVTTAITAKNLN